MSRHYLSSSLESEASSHIHYSLSSAFGVFTDRGRRRFSSDQLQFSGLWQFNQVKTHRPGLSLRQRGNGLTHTKHLRMTQVLISFSLCDTFLLVFVTAQPQTDPNERTHCSGRAGSGRLRTEILGASGNRRSSDLHTPASQHPFPISDSTNGRCTAVFIRSVPQDGDKEPSI